MIAAPEGPARRCPRERDPFRVARLVRDGAIIARGSAAILLHEWRAEGV